MMQSIRLFLGKNADLALVALVMGVLLILFAPIPSGLLDFLILMNVGFALLILLVTFYAPRPVEFSTFPAILLVATLFRLSLNVSATRLILSEGDAGRVIGAVGSYVVGGNYVIGLIVFLILVVVQYVVVTSGAQRVSEVAARFTLDSMPGQQMSIDADLNMGFIDQDEAKRRRKNLEREAAFYGAMDGASKFVKGDAIAGIVIMLINIIGGLVIGVLQMGMPWGEALRHFTLLTIGDGIVTQVPALVVSVGTGLIVTRSASDAMLGLEVFRQITAYPKTIVIVALALIGIAFLPGMPVVPPVLLVIGLGALYFLKANRGKGAAKGELDGAETSKDADDAYEQSQVDPVEMLLGTGLAAVLGGDEKTVLLDRVAEFRKQFATDMGFVLPKVKFKDSATAQPNQYEIAMFGDVVATGTVMPGHLLAIHPTGNTSLVPGIETKDPSYGLPALWIEPSQRDAARAAKFTLVDPVTVLVTHLSETLRLQSASLVTRTEADRMLARLRVSQPGLVEELVPTQLSVGDVQKVLQGLMKEKVPIRNLQAIVETLIDAAKASKDTGILVEFVRQRLATTICNALSPDKKVLNVLTLHPEIEGQLLQTIGGAGEPGRAAHVDPRLTETVLLKLAQQAERMMKNSMTPILLCPVELRRHIRTLSERAIPHLRVLSVAEIPIQFELKSYASVSL